MKLWFVIDEGCQECGVPSVPIGVYLTAEEADAAVKARNLETDGWRLGGQTYASAYEMDAPSSEMQL